MTDAVQGEGAPRARDEGDVPVREEKEEEHWEGYPGAERAESYPVVDRGRYKLLLLLTFLAFVGTAIAIATRESENLPQQERGLTPR